MHTFSLRHIALRRTALAAALALAHTAWAGTATVALTGQFAPGLGVAGRFNSFDAPLLNAAGQVAFEGTLIGSGFTAANNAGIWSNGGLVARTGTAAPGAGSGASFAGFSSLTLSDAGQVAYLGDLTGAAVTTANNAGIWRDGTLIVRKGHAAGGTSAGVTFASLIAPQINASGQVVFSARLTGAGVTAANDGGVWRGNDLIARNGDAAPGAGSGVSFAGFFRPRMGDDGTVVYGALLTGTGVSSTNDRGLWRGTSLIAREDTPFVDNSAVVMSSLGDDYQVNARGQVSYQHKLRVPGLSGDSGSVIMLGNTVVAKTGASGSPAAGEFFVALSNHQLNAAGQVAFSGTLGGLSSDSGIWRNETQIARTGTAAPGGGTASFSSLSAPQLNAAGAVAFTARLSGAGLAANSQGLYLGDGMDTLQAARTGDSLAGSTIASLAVSASSFNDKAQVAYTATLADGRSGVFIFTPTLHWRSNASGSWDSAAHWTLGVTPADVHDVDIDAATSLRITGPTGAVTLKSLQVGTGTGLVTLQMAGGSIDAADPVLIGPRGVLSGTGSFSRLVINQGTVQADHLVLTASLSNAGLVRGVAGGPRNGAGLDADLLNQASGRVLVQPGETLQLRGASHRNLGVFEINQGRLEVAGTLLNGSGGVIDLNRATALAEGAWTNAAGARLLLGDARLTVSKGLTNAGQVLVTSGDSDVFGAVVNQKAGQVLLSGQGTTTFYDTVELQSGSELRTSAGATAVFFGAVAQRSGALLTGTGHKYFEGGFSVGNSPGLGEDAGSVSFGLGSTYLAEIGGTALGSGYDHYRVAGTLTLGGTLQLVSFAGFVAQDGQEFDLFDAGTLHGQFSGIDSSGLLLAAGTTLDASRLYTDGVIRVTAVPEPESWALMAAGLLGLGLRASQRRRHIATPSA
ncbi:MAG: PEP-CTERM sorting domain-containing protein [Pelomonas sp.]|nr:PEP-CTERM sorting domain-containing protein [Roseateles sp.]